MLTAQVEGAPSVMEYIEREYRAAQPYHHEGHEFLAREYPNLSIEEQQCLEDTLVAAHEGAAASPEWAWSAIGTVVARLTEVARHLEGLCSPSQGSYPRIKHGAPQRWRGDLAWPECARGGPQM